MLCEHTGWETKSALSNTSARLRLDSLVRSFLTSKPLLLDTNLLPGITDMPGTCVLPELMELYPYAKVVLVTRDPEKWYESIAPLLGNSYNVDSQALMSIDPGFRWFPATVEEFSLAMGPLAATVGKKPGDWGPCEFAFVPSGFSVSSA